MLHRGGGHGERIVDAKGRRHELDPGASASRVERKASVVLSCSFSVLPHDTP
jgi:hypothetical protein